MSIEEKFGPQGIWQKESEEMKKNNYQPEMEFGSEDDEEEGDEEQEEGDEDEEDEDEEQEDDESGDDDHSQENSDDEEKPPRKSSAHQNKGTDSKKKKKKTTDYDQIALRQYELSKLRYYFAIADCDSIETANVLYEQLDDVEMGDSGMVFEMRFVPDDLDLSSREVSSTCSVIPHNYKPPEFVINALQSTNVECSWDEGEKDREKKLTNISSWRSLKESEFMQYIASSDSEDYEDESNAEHSNSEEENSEEEESEEEKPRKGAHQSKKMQQLGSGGSVGSSGSMKSLKKKKKAKNLRALLLGDHSTGADEDEDEEKNINKDDFFAHADNHSGSESNESDDDEDRNQKKTKTKKTSKKGSAHDMDLPPMDENGEITFSYVPEADAQEEKEASLEGLTPYEIELKKSSERKKQRKQDRKQVVEGLQQNQADALKKIQDDLKKKKKKQILEEDEQEFNDEDRLVHQLKPWEVERQASNEKKRQRLEKKLKKKKHSGFEEAVEDDGSHKNNKIGAEAEVDVTDERFRRIFEGSDSNFGIDRTFNEFKETKGMKTILQEQKKRREMKGKANASTDNTNNANTDKQEISSLANKLKRKFSAAN
jgi:hypothetical protein